MSNSKNLQTTSQDEKLQHPLGGFRVEVESGKDGWKKLVEGMGNGRVRIHMTKIKK